MGLSLLLLEAALNQHDEQALNSSHLTFVLDLLSLVVAVQKHGAVPTRLHCLSDQFLCLELVLPLASLRRLSLFLDFLISRHASNAQGALQLRFQLKTIN